MRYSLRAFPWKLQVQTHYNSAAKKNIPNASPCGLDITATDTPPLQQSSGKKRLWQYCARRLVIVREAYTIVRLSERKSTLLRALHDSDCAGDTQHDQRLMQT